MDNCDLVYFVNSQGKRAVLSSPDNPNYWELRGRSGFTAPDVDIFTKKFASGAVKYLGKVLKPRTCSMKMVCIGKDTAERDQIFFEMLDTLLDYKGEGEGKLYVKRSDGSIYYLNCVYSGGMNIVEQYQKFHLFTLSFYAADPLFYASAKYQFSGSDGILMVKNPFDYTLWPVLHFDDKPQNTATPADHPTITNTTTNKSIVLTSTDDDPQLPGTSISYENVDIITAEQDRGIYGEAVRYDDTRIAYGPIPQALVSASINFPVAPGANTITWADCYSYNAGWLKLDPAFYTFGV